MEPSGLWRGRVASSGLQCTGPPAPQTPPSLSSFLSGLSSCSNNPRRSRKSLLFKRLKRNFGRVSITLSKHSQYLCYLFLSKAPFAEGRSAASVILSLHLIKDGVTGPERRGLLPVLAHGDRHGLAALGGNHLKVYLDQISSAVRTAAPFTLFSLKP